MPIRQEDIERYDLPIYFRKEGEVHVFTGPNSVKSLKSKTIPIDGRIYACAGKIYTNCGTILRANFNIDTSTSSLLEKDSIWVLSLKEAAWYRLDDPEMWESLSLIKEDALPLLWTTDRPLNGVEECPKTISEF